MKKILTLLILLLPFYLIGQQRSEYVGNIDMSSSDTVLVSFVQSSNWTLYVRPKNLVGSGGSYTFEIGADIDKSGTIDAIEWINYDATKFPFPITTTESQAWTDTKIQCENFRIIATKGSLTGGTLEVLIIYERR